jgi:anti-sigma factor RsiW
MSASHRDTLDSIPWLVNGRIADEERRAFEEHLSECAECREELATQRRVQAAMVREPRVEYAPGVSLQKLWTRIGDDDAVEASSPRARMLSHVRQRAVHWLAAAVVVEAIGITLLAMLPRTQPPLAASAPPAYRTVTTTDVLPQNAALRVVFAPSMALSDLNALLQQQHLEIVNGPSPAGVYTLAANASTAQLADTLIRLRRHAGVQFAELIAIESGARR